MFKFIKKYFSFYKDYKLQIFLSLIGMILVAVSTSGIAYLIKPVLDKIFIEHNKEMLYILPFFVILAYLAKGIGSFLQAYYMSYIGEDIVRRVRNKLLKHLMNLDIAFFQNYHSGELISRITNDINRIQSAVSTQFASLVRESLTAVSLLFVVVYQSPKLALFIFLLVPLIIWPVNFLSKKMKKISHKSQEKNSDITEILSEIFSNIELIKAYNSNEYESKKFEEHNFKFFKLNMKAVKVNQLLIPVMETFSALAAAIVIFVGGKEVIDGNLTVGEFFSFMTALFMLTDPLRKISVTYNRFQDAIAADERIEKLFELTPKIISGNKNINAIDNIKFQNVYLKYNDKYALKNINFEAKRGDVVGLIGDSGGGKTSFINLLVRFYDVSEGKILFNNINIKDISLESLRKNIAIVTQRIYIFNDTIASNIAYGEDIDENRVKEALKKANLLDFVESLEDGIYTKLKENGSNLSGGQRQRIAIARALYKNPSVLILDEATSALDNISEKEVMNTIYNLKDLIIFIIAHRLNTIQNANKILVFKNGEIVCQGDIKSLDSCNEFKRLYHKG